jgi:RimJ/RimL family protein N-acetyltransferase
MAEFGNAYHLHLEDETHPGGSFWVGFDDDIYRKASDAERVIGGCNFKEDSTRPIIVWLPKISYQQDYGWDQLDAALEAILERTREVADAVTP